MRRLLVALIAVLLIVAAPARADDTYTVDSCLTAAGTAATVDGWSFNRASIQQLAEEIRNVRVWGGIHFRTSVDIGYDMGRKIAVFLVENSIRPTN